MSDGTTAHRFARVAPGLEVERFVREREGRWRRFEQLLRDVERLPDHEMGAERLLELVRLYRQTCSDLNEARSYTANAELLSRLNALAGRGYRLVYRRSRGRLLAGEVRRFLTEAIPRAFRKERLAVLVATGAFLAGILVGFGAVIADRTNGHRLVPEEFFTESPRERVEKIETSKERIASIQEASEFGAYLFSHNIQVSFLAFSLGAVSIVGGVWILFYNGVIFGAIAALYVLDGVHVFFMAWVGPHGALELPAIVFAGAAGICLGRALLAPGDLSTGASVREAFPVVWRMLVGVCVILVVAGLVEGSFSQFTAKTVPHAAKIGVAAALFAGLLFHLFARRLGEDEA